MASPPPLLLLPKEIEFQATNTAVAKTFKLENTSDNGVIYRIKTTAPKRYMVRPNIGFIPPKAGVTIKVSMNLSKDPKTDPKSDKFQVQSLFFQSNGNLDENAVKEIWADSKGKELFKQRIKARLIQEGASGTPSMDASQSTNSINTLSDSIHASLTASEEPTAQIPPVVPVVTPSLNVRDVSEQIPKPETKEPKKEPPVASTVTTNPQPVVKEMNRYSSTVTTAKPAETGTGEVEQLKREKAALTRQIQEYKNASKFTIGNILILLLALMFGYMLAKFLPY